VANAVADAVEHLGVRVRRTPLTPCVVWELLRSADS
jgi:aerobic carbon-monoxide dehydrogenase large subunit